MNIELLRAYDEANKLRELGKNVPSSLLERINKLEKKLISLDLVPRIEDLMDYILQGYKSPVSLNIKYYPDTQEIIVDELPIRAIDYKKVRPLAPPKEKRINDSPRQPLNSFGSMTLQAGEKIEIKTTSQNTTNNINTPEDEVKKFLDEFMRMKLNSGSMGLSKTIMLLSIFSLISNGYFINNIIEFDERLATHYKYIWDKLVHQKLPHTHNSCRSFVYLIKEPFFIYEIKRGKRGLDLRREWDKNSIKSHIKYISLDHELFLLVKNKSTRIQFIKFLTNLFGLTPEKLYLEEQSDEKPTKDVQFSEGGTVEFDEFYDELDVNDYILCSKVDEYNQNEIAYLRPSDLWRAVAIASLGNKKKSYVIYDALMQPLTKERIIRFMLRAMITRVLLSYRYDSEVNSKIPNPNQLEIIDSLLKCTIFKEIDANTRKQTDYVLTMNRSITGFQIYTEFRNLTQKVYDCLMGDKHQELPNEFNRFVKIVAKQAFLGNG